MTALPAVELSAARQRHRWWLGIILVYAAASRIWLDSSGPRGLNADEASNVWNAWCLLHTGRDEWGNHWPIVALQAFNDFRSTAYVYALMPVQWLGGLSDSVARLPSAVSGVICIWFTYLIGRRLFDRTVGLTAAALMTIMPWSLLSTDMAHEADLVPAQFAVALLALLWAGAPVTDLSVEARPLRAALAGVACGIAMYGYAALRAELPIMLIVLAIAHWRTLLARMRDARFGKSVLWFALISFALASPIVTRHLFDPRMNTRIRETRAEPAPLTHRLQHAAALYGSHFGPKFLFTEFNSTSPFLAGPSHEGALQLYWLPLLLIGAVVVLGRVSRSASARTLLTLLLIFPAANVVFYAEDKPHPFYCNIGMVPLSLLAAVGAATVLRWLDQRRRELAITVGVFLAIIASGSHVKYLLQLAEWRDSVDQRGLRNTDLAVACDRLAAEWDNIDEVFCTQRYFVYPYELSLIFLHYSPEKWLGESRGYAVPHSTIIQKLTCVRYGKMNFVYDADETATRLSNLKAGTRVMMILRPEEAALAGDHSPTAVVSFGREPRLYIFEFVR